VVPTSRQELIQLCLQGIDGDEGVYLLKGRQPGFGELSPNR
jgi:hypothetical protein